MSDLQNQTPANTFKGLLQVDDYTNGVDGTSKFVQDGEGTDSALSISTTKVGIGTTSPSEKLEISNDNTNGIGDAAIAFTDQAGIRYAMGIKDGSQAFQISEGSPLGQTPTDETKGTRFLIDTNGNVGIGTTDPFADLTSSGGLHIAGNIPRLRLQDDNPESDGVWDIVNDNSLFTIQHRNADGTTVHNYLHIEDDGKVGIGTPSPETKFNINEEAGTLDVLQSFSKAGVGKARIGLSGMTSQVLQDALTNDLCIRSDGHNIKFGTASQTRTDMTIDPSGRVGIGTISPAAKLDIEDSLRLSAYAGAAIWHLETGADRIDIKENGTTSRLVVQDGGNVGINTGTSSPGATLQVDANDDTTGAYAFWVRNKARTNSIILAHENGDVQLGQFIYKDGNPDTYRVGLGTLSPSAPLEVASTTGGVIMPRMTTTQMNAISSPTDGEMIYNTTENKFYGRANGAWTPLH